MLNVYVPGPLHVIRRRKTTPYFHRVIVSKSVVPNAWAPPPVQQARTAVAVGLPLFREVRKTRFYRTGTIF